VASKKLAYPISHTGSWIGGVALLLIAILAGVGYFGALAPLIATRETIQTAADIAGSEPQFRLGVLCMVLAAILDVIVAAVLLAMLEPVNRIVATTAAWFRIVYSAVFLVAITQLAIVPTLLGDPQSAMNAIESYNIIWRTGLILFAIHLFLVGYLGFRSGFMPKVLAALIAIAGIGYLVDGIGTILVPDYTPTISTFTFVGEVALIGWLIWKGSRKRTATNAP
jgi:hypothetical protein